MLTAACMMIVKVHSLPPEKSSAEKLKVQQQEQKSGSETSSYTVSSEQLEAIDAVIDGLFQERSVQAGDGGGQETSRARAYSHSPEQEQK